MGACSRSFGLKRPLLSHFLLRRLRDTLTKPVANYQARVIKVRTASLRLQSWLRTHASTDTMDVPESSGFSFLFSFMAVRAGRYKSTRDQCESSRSTVPCGLHAVKAGSNHCKPGSKLRVSTVSSDASVGNISNFHE